jgi:hypothetical protein
LVLILNPKFSAEADEPLAQKSKSEMNNMDILRFIAAGSVDDGKSTLIGRLLYDSKSVLMDQLKRLACPGI